MIRVPPKHFASGIEGDNVPVDIGFFFCAGGRAIEDDIFIDIGAFDSNFINGPSGASQVQFFNRDGLRLE